MTSSTIDQITKADAEALKSGGDLAKHHVNSDINAAIKNGFAVKQAIKAHDEVLTRSGNAAFAGFEKLAKAYQASAAKSAQRLSASMKLFAAVKTPLEFMELQRRLMKESVEIALSDFDMIAKTTAAAFAGASAPLREEVASAVHSISK
jgi:hypothetical protein